MASPATQVVRRSPASKPSRYFRQHRLKIAVAVVLSAIIFLLAVTIFAVLYRPAWFQPRTIDYSLLENDKGDFVNLMDSIGHALNHDQAISIGIGQEQLNRWIVAKRELPRAERFSCAPFQHPQVEFLSDGHVRVSGLASWHGFDTVISCQVTCSASNDNIRCRIDAIHAGLLPIPREWVINQIVARRGVNAGNSENDWVFMNDLQWPNGNRRFRIKNLQITEGRVLFSFVPLSR